MTTVLFYNINELPDSNIENYLRMLPDIMQKQIVKYRYIKDRKYRLLSRLMILDVLTKEKKKHFIYNWKEDENHKPYIENWHHFNISHSGDIVVIAYSEDIVGIDIEKRESIHWKELITNFHYSEQQLIVNSSVPLDTFYDVWVKKEAMLKSIGTGIVNGLNVFSCIQNEIIYNKKTFYLTPLNIENNYTSYLCCSKQQNININNFSLSNL